MTAASPVSTDIYSFGTEGNYFRNHLDVPTPAKAVPHYTTPPVSPAFRDSWHGVCSWVKTYCVEGPAGSGGTNVVAIDNKIEQAMDLVKTHLMYAVREEVELLRTKITELEAKVIYLERENAVLREHVPQEVLTKLLPPVVSGSPAAVMGLPVQAQITAPSLSSTVSPGGAVAQPTLTSTSGTQVRDLS